jgi:MSHA biogenesis protein MshO
MRVRGFTLIELLTVITITGIIAAVLTVFLRPAIDSYLDTRRRANLTDIADTALRRMGQDIRSAVPNSVRTDGTTSCFQLVPTTTGGRYRMALDTSYTNTATSSALDITAATTRFDVFNRMRTIPSVNDWVVINNQNTLDVYSGANRSLITGVATPTTPGGVPIAAVGQHRIAVSSKQFPSGYDGGRFQVVSNATPTIVYSYVASTRTLHRAVTAFSTAFPSALCGTGAIVATNVASSEFIYVPNKGATQQSGFLQMSLTLSDAGESITLVHGVHVENAP